VSIEKSESSSWAHLREPAGNVVECIDNDETASVNLLARARKVPRHPHERWTASTATRAIRVRSYPPWKAKTTDEILQQNRRALYQLRRRRAARAANGARAKLDFIKQPIREARLSTIAQRAAAHLDLLNGTGRCTVFRVR
jgi:hypothetical protein